MQELSLQEVDGVSGALGMNEALDIIGGIAAVCAVIPGLQGAAAFGAGVFLGGKLVMAM
jgi:hypothetical protein